MKDPGEPRAQCGMPVESVWKKRVDVVEYSSASLRSSIDGSRPPSWRLLRGAGTIIDRHDRGGNLTQGIDGRGAVVNYTYDALDRLFTRTNVRECAYRTHRIPCRPELVAIVEADPGVAALRRAGFGTDSYVEKLLNETLQARYGPRDLGQESITWCKTVPYKDEESGHDCALRGF